MGTLIKKSQLLNFSVLTKRKLFRQLMILTIFVIICLITSSAVYSAVPVVKNQSLQRNFGSMVIRYDLLYSEPGTVNISLECSYNTGGAYSITPHSVTGAVGDVLPGTGKQINWNVDADLPGANIYLVRVRLIASSATNTIRYVTKKGADMVLIPSGSFQMGSLATTDGMPIFGDEVPKHTVSEDAYYMDTHEVTNAQYADFMSATGHAAPLYWNDSRFNAPTKPVIGVTWDDAVTYCNWAGKRLPTEAEWEKASRGGLVGKEFPWGNTLDRNYGNFASVEGPDTWNDTSPVCSFMPNDYGLFDMIGNAYEWCSDYYEYYYYDGSPGSNPPGPDTGQSRVLRGGSCYDGFFPSYLRCATRYSYISSTTDGIVGFRCVSNTHD